jgi:hypothetical protein
MNFMLAFLLCLMLAVALMMVPYRMFLLSELRPSDAVTQGEGGVAAGVDMADMEGDVELENVVGSSTGNCIDDKNKLKWNLSYLFSNHSSVEGNVVTDKKNLLANMDCDDDENEKGKWSDVY